MNPINISTSPAVLRWQPTAWLRVSGADAASFLQGQFTNELRGLAVGGAVYGLWLTVKGKVLADSFVLRGGVGAGEAGEEFWVGSYFSPAAVIRERLESFVIADDVTVEDRTAEFAGLSVIGAGAEGKLRAAGAATDGGSAWVFGGGGDLPNEAGLDAEAISYTKGCYLGQEVMARLKSMGRVRRRLLRVKIAGSVRPASPAAVLAEGKPVGELRSVARAAEGGFIGLAMMTLLSVTAATPLALAEGASVSLVDAP